MVRFQPSCRHMATGHTALENSVTASVPGRAINLARQGFVVFTYDMIGYNDSRQLEHRLFGGPREKLWGLGIAGLQLWNAIRWLDFLESLPFVRRGAIGATGASGGDPGVSARRCRPTCGGRGAGQHDSLQMQGGCLCENQPGLRLETTNVEIAATIAPRPLLMVSATGDWTTNTMEREYPAVRAVYSLRARAIASTPSALIAAQLQPRIARGGVGVDGALAAKRAGGRAARRGNLYAGSAPGSARFHQRPIPQNAVDGHN